MDRFGRVDLYTCPFICERADAEKSSEFYGGSGASL